MGNATTRAVAAELIGSFIYFFIGAGAIVADSFSQGGVGLLGIAVAHGIILSVMVSAFGATSGGHLNPAVSVAFFITGRLSASLTALYVVAQLMGGVLAGFALRSVYASAVWQPVQLGTPALAQNVDFTTGVLVELFMTFFLVIAVFGTAVDERAPRSIAGFGIGLTLMVSMLVGGPVTGAALNPARTFGPAVAAGFFDNHLVYWIGPIVGGGLAALVYQFLIMPPAEVTPTRR